MGRAGEGCLRGQPRVRLDCGVGHCRQSRWASAVYAMVDQTLESRRSTERIAQTAHLRRALDPPRSILFPATHVDVLDAGGEARFPHANEDVPESDSIEREVSAGR